MSIDEHGQTELTRFSCIDSCSFYKIMSFNPDVNVQDKLGQTPLMYSVMFEDDNMQIMSKLIQAGALVNTQDEKKQTTLIHASQPGHVKNVKFLLDVKNIDVDVQDKWGDTALFKASANGHVEVVRLLLGKNANVDLETENGETALSIAEDKGHQEIVLVLLAYNNAENES